MPPPGGFDRAVFYDTVGDDVYAAWSDRAYMIGTGYYNEARGFDAIAHATLGGNDRAFFMIRRATMCMWPGRTGR